MRSSMGIDFLRRQAPVVALGLVGAMFCAPFLVGWHHLPIPSFFNELVAAGLGLLACALLLRKRYWQEWQFPSIGLLPLGLVLLLILQVVTGLAVFPQQNMLAALYLLWACCLIMLGAVLRREFELQKIILVLCRFTLLAAVLSSLIGLQQLFHFHSVFDSWLTVPVSDRLVANLGQPNHLADLLALGLISLLLLRARGELGILATLASASLLLFVMGLTGSRSTWLYLFSIALTAMWGGLRGKNNHLVFAAWLLLPAYALVQWISSLIVGYMNIESMTSAERLLSSGDAISLRWPKWQHAWSLFLDAPLMGAGFGRFAWTMFDAPGFSPEVSNLEGPAEHAHNLILHLLAEMGLPAAFLVCAFTLVWAWRLVLSGYSREHWWLLAAATILGLHSMFEYPLWYAHFLGVAAILAGLSETAFMTIQIRFGRALVFTILLLGGFNLVNLTRDYVRIESVIGFSSRVGQEVGRISADVQILADINRDSLLAPYATLAVAFGIRPDPVHLREQLEVCELAQRFSPSKNIVFKYAVLLALAGESQKAEQQMRKAVKAYPGDVPEVIRQLKGWVAEGVLILNPLLNFLMKESSQKN